MWALSKYFPKNRIKTPTVLQMENTECGAASLCMVLAHYGRWIPLEKMRQECGVNRDGVSAGNIVRAATNLGCKAVGYRWTAQRLKKEVATYPLILHWEFNHFLVLEGIENDICYLNDPAMGHRQVPFADFRTSYTGIALAVKPGEKFVTGGSKYNIVKVLSEKLQQNKKATLFVLIACACLIVPGLAIPVFGQVFLDDILTAKHADWMNNLLFAMVLTVFVQGLLIFLRSWCLTRWQTKLTLHDSAQFFWHVLHLPMEFFQQRYGAEVASRVAFNESVADVLTGSAATAVLDFCVAIFYLLLLLQYNVTLTIIGVGFNLVGVLVYFAFRNKLLEMTMKVQQDIGKSYAVAMNGLLVIETLKANGNEEEFFSKWAGYKAKIIAGNQRITLYNTTIQMLPLLLSGVNTALIMMVGGFAIMDGLMTAGIFIAFQNLMGNFQTPFNNLLTLAESLQTTEMQMKRLDDVMRYKVDALNYPELAAAEQIGTAVPENAENKAEVSTDTDAAEKDMWKAARLSGALSMEHIVFGYSPLHQPLFKDFHLELAPGQWVALVGGSGSGKSTIAKIITGLYEQWEGRVAFDGVPREAIPREIICNSLASVDQDIVLFSGTVADNITLFDDTIRRSDVLRAARDACIDDDILKLEGGFDAEVDENGLNFSGGQRQRLEIARALASNPSILVLDEATSALDPLTEVRVMENIRKRGCSCIIVAHRLSTIRDCDEIIVINHGRIAERGTHDALLAQNGAYKKLIMEQDALAAEEGQA